MSAAMRFGLVGTGYWAREVHGPGVRSARDAELVGVWGRRPDAAREVAAALDVPAHDDVDALVEAVDALVFAVPPHVQADVATRAAERGRHLLLEKPLALDVAAGEALVAAVERSGAATAVFVTARYTPDRDAWDRELAAAEPRHGGWARVLAPVHQPGSPFDTPWRREKGALWDVGPHLLDGLEAAVGAPVERVVSATRGERDLVHLVLAHAGGATSTVTATLWAPREAQQWEVGAWGPGGVVTAPARQGPAHAASARAVDELVACARSGDRHPVDAREGLRHVRLLAQAEALLRR